MRALATNFGDDPRAASRPFDADRCGFVIAEGAGAVVLEEEAHARARGVHVYAEVRSKSCSSENGGEYSLGAPSLPELTFGHIKSYT